MQLTNSCGFFQRRQYRQPVAQGARLVCADEVSSTCGGGKLCSECRGPDIPGPRPVSARRKDLRETDRSTGKSKRSRNSSNRASTESEVSGAAPRKPHAGIKDKAVAFDTGTRQRRDARVKERRNVIHDVASGCLRRSACPSCTECITTSLADDFANCG